MCGCSRSRWAPGSSGKSRHSAAAVRRQHGSGSTAAAARAVTMRDFAQPQLPIRRLPLHSCGRALSIWLGRSVGYKRPVTNDVHSRHSVCLKHHQFKCSRIAGQLLLARMVAAVPAALFGSAICQSAAKGTVLRLLPSSLPHGLVTVRLCRSGKDVEGSWSASSRHCCQRSQLQHSHGMPGLAHPTQQAACCI